MSYYYVDIGVTTDTSPDTLSAVKKDSSPHCPHEHNKWSFKMFFANGAELLCYCGLRLHSLIEQSIQSDIISSIIDLGVTGK